MNARPRHPLTVILTPRITNASSPRWRPTVSRPVVWLLLLGLSVLQSFSLSLAAADQLYTCGMHPQVIKKEPGNCPICHMALTPVRSNAGAAGERKIKYYKSTMMPGEVSPQPGKDSMGMEMVPVYEDDAAASTAIHIDTGTIQRMNLKTDIVTRGPVQREIRNVGLIAYDETGLRDITLKYEGWLEKLFVNASWATVQAGDPLFEIYSPDLYNAQLNYLVALRAEGPEEGGALTRAALARLQLFDVSEDFIAGLRRTGEPRRTYLHRAPAAGVVIEIMAVAGQMMEPGERIYRLADLSTVWVHAQIYENDLPFVHAGQTATVRATYGRDRDRPATVGLLLPQIEEQTRTATARLVLPNPDGALRPGMFVDVRLSARLTDDAVLVPEMAVLRSGERNTVFLANADGTFTPREVKLGARSQDGRYEVLAGLAEGDRVVTSGQFMLDSESQLREAIQKMLKADGKDAAMADNKSANVGAAHQEDLPEAAKVALTKLARALADASAALADDDLSAYRRQLPGFRAALAEYFQADPHAGHGPLGGFRDAPREPVDLDSARNEFAPLSTAIADLARAQHIHHREGLHLFQCPMAPGIGEGRWLQRDGDLKNPFFGSRMLTCGDELDAADACGGCGMSAAAMAAGEPFDHQNQPPRTGRATASP